MGNIMSIQIKRIGKQEYKYEVTWDEKEKKQRWRYIGKVTNGSEPVGKLADPVLTARLKFLFYGSLVISVLIGFFVHAHPHFWWESNPAFHAIYGFIVCVFIILGSKSLGHYIKREVNYYD
jgi:hypothetical protein